MFTKFVLRPLSRPFLSPTHFFPIPSSLRKPLTLSLLSTSTTSTTTTIAISTTIDQTLPYGPSLHKGHKLAQHHQPQPSVQPKLQEDRYEEEEEENNDNLFDEENFTRVFDIAALRVPSEHCFALESRLRGHLLNWPRIRNIARVPGDEVQVEFKNFLKHQSSSNSNDHDDESLVSLNRRIYGKAERDGEPLSPVLYRDKLANTFNSRGFVKFRNLAKMSRPKKRKKKEEKEGKEKREKKGSGRNDFAVVEVVEEERDEEGEDFSGLLGDEFKGSKWKGSTRLLLLDERYANKAVDEMPEAIKVSVPTL